MNTLTISDVLDVEYPKSPLWSVDGAYVAVPVYENDGRVLRIAAAETDRSNSWQVTSNDGFVAEVAWVPNPKSERLSFIIDEGELFVVGAIRETTELLTDHVDTDDVAWSSDGECLALYRDGCPCVIGLDDTTHRYDVPERGEFLGENRMLAWGPDDRLLAYRFVDRDTKQIGVLDTTTSEVVWRNREAAFSTRNPEWLADGRLLVDRLGMDGAVREFVAIDVEDGIETVLFHDEDRMDGIVSRDHPVISPDGTRVAATLPLDGWEHLYVFDPDTGERTQLTSGEFEDKGFADSPPQWLDNETLVFASNRRDSGHRDLFAVQFDQDEAGPSVQSLVTGAGTDVYPRPFPDGDRIAYVHTDASVSPEVRLAKLNDALDQRHNDETEPAATDIPIFSTCST